MIEDNYRRTVHHFINDPPQSEAHSAPLIQQRDSSQYISLGVVPGNSYSSIEKMTHPLATRGPDDVMAPYMLYLLGNPSLLAFAQRVLREPRQRFMDQWGIDDAPRASQHTDLVQALTYVTQFYNQTTETRPYCVILNQRPFLVQEPTRPYFEGQQLITPDFTCYRSDQQRIKNSLLQCRVRDDSQLYVNKQPVLAASAYVAQVAEQEFALRIREKYANETRYYLEMIEYLHQAGKPGDIVAQNTLDSCSDPYTPHWQFIPAGGDLPLFLQHYDEEMTSTCCTVNWHLSTVMVKLAPQEIDWRQQAIRLQEYGLALFDNQHISVLPVLKKIEEDVLHLYLIFKKDTSTYWNLSAEQAALHPGWLEACGVFITNTAKAEKIDFLGPAAYYAPYTLEPSALSTIKNTLERVLS